MTVFVRMITERGATYWVGLNRSSMADGFSRSRMCVGILSQVNSHFTVSLVTSVLYLRTLTIYNYFRID